MTTDVIPFPVSNEDDLHHILARPDSVQESKWEDVVGDVWLALEESYRLLGYEGVVVLSETGGGYRAYTGMLANHDDVDPDDINLNLIGGGREEEEQRIPPLPLVDSVHYISSISEKRGLENRLSGAGGVTSSKEGGVNIVDSDEIILCLDATADVQPSHKTQFHVVTDDHNWKLWRFDEDDEFELQPALANRVFVDEYPARTHYCTYITKGDLVHLAIPEHHHAQILKNDSDEIEDGHYVTPEHPKDGVVYHPCVVVHSDPDSVSVRLMGTDDDIRSFVDGELSDVFQGKLLPAPRSEQSFNGNRVHS